MMSYILLLVLCAGVAPDEKPGPPSHFTRNIADCRVTLVEVRDGCHVLTGEGESCWTAQGIWTERDWLDEKYPGHKMVLQENLISKEKPRRRIDSIKIETASGDKVVECFDLTDLWAADRAD